MLSRVASESVWAAVTNYVDWVIFSQSWGLEVCDQGVSMVRFLVIAFSPGYRRLSSHCVLTWQRDGVSS